MFITIKHTISDPEKFWNEAKHSLSNLPDGIRIHSVMPDDTMTMAICLWEADTLEQMRDYLENKVGDISENEYMIVNEMNSMGLPSKS